MHFGARSGGKPSWSGLLDPVTEAQNQLDSFSLDTEGMFSLKCHSSAGIPSCLTRGQQVNCIASSPEKQHPARSCKAGDISSVSTKPIYLRHGSEWDYPGHALKREGRTLNQGGNQEVVQPQIPREESMSRRGSSHCVQWGPNEDRRGHVIMTDLICDLAKSVSSSVGSRSQIEVDWRNVPIAVFLDCSFQKLSSARERRNEVNLEEDRAWRGWVSAHRCVLQT